MMFRPLVTRVAKKSHAIYLSFSELQRAVLLALALVVVCTICGVRSPFFSYFLFGGITYLFCAKALSRGYYVGICRDFFVKRQNQLYDLLDDHPPALKKYTFYPNQSIVCSEALSHNNKDCNLTDHLSNGEIPISRDDHMPEYKIEASKIVQHIFKDFVLSWYLTISDELTFAQNIHVVLEELVITIEKNLKTVDRFEFSKRIIKMYTSHLADYQKNLDVLKTQPKYQKRNITFTKLNSILEVYEKQEQFHPAIASDEAELNHIRSILCSAIRKLVPPDRLTSISGLELIVEILARSVLQPLVNLLQESDYIYELLIKILAVDDEAIFEEISNLHKNIPNGKLNHSDSKDEQKSRDLTLRHLQDVVELVTAKSRRFLKSFTVQDSDLSISSSLSEQQQRLRAMTTPYEDIDMQYLHKDSVQSSVGSSVEIIETDEDLDPVNYELLKVRTESNVSDYLMIVPNEDEEDCDIVRSNLDRDEKRLRRALTEERRPRTLTRQRSLPTLKEVGDSISIDHDISQPSSPTSPTSETDSLKSDNFADSSPRSRRDSESSFDGYDNISICSGEFAVNDDKNSTLTGSTGSLDRPPDLTLLHESLATLPDVTSSTSLFENLFVTRTEAMQEYGSPDNHYVCYVIQYDGWYYSGSGLTRIPRIVRRRFREFVALQERLNENPVCKGLLKGIRGPNRWLTLPFNKLDNKTVEKRKGFLQQYLQALIKKQPIAVSQEMKEFLAYDSDASLAFVRKAPDMPVQWLDKMLLKPVSGVFDKISTVLPSLPVTSSEPRDVRAAEPATRRRDEYATVLPDRDDDALRLEYMIVADSEKFSISRLPLLMTRFLHKRADDVTNAHCDVTKSTDVTTSDCDVTRVDPDVFYDAEEDDRPVRRNSKPSNIRAHPVTSLFADMPLACSVLDLGAQLTADLKLGFYNEQVLGVFYVLIGWYFDRFLRSEIVDISCESMVARYLYLVRTALWPETDEPDEVLKTQEQQAKTREWAAKCLVDFFPWFIPLAAGAENIEKSAELIMASLEHPKLNRHLIFTALDLIVDTLVPDVSENDDVVRGTLRTASQPSDVITGHDLPT